MRQQELAEKNSLDNLDKPNSVEDGFSQVDVKYDGKEARRILWKVDIRIIPLMTFLLTLAFLDRTNIGNARVAGLDTELNLSSAKYNICLMMFFITYGLFEVPANIMLKRLRPSLWISTIMVIWGVVVTLQGLVQNYEQLIVFRLLLGLFEAGFGPGAAFILTLWYRRLEIQGRLAIYLSANCISGAFSGLLAFAIQKMEGVGGLSGWRWIFILEGMFTCFIGIAVFFILPDSPETASFLTPEERKFMTDRLESDSGTSRGKVSNNEKFAWKFVWAALLDWKIWLAALTQWCSGVVMYAFTFTLPTIIHRLGYSSTHAQLLTIPVYTFGVIAMVTCGFLSDMWKTRYLFIVGPSCLTTLSLIAMLVIPQTKLPGLAYGMLFPLCAGIYPAMTAIICLVMNNVAPSSKRAIGIAIYFGFGNLGGMVGTNIFVTNQAPQYRLGYVVCLAHTVGLIVFSTVLRLVHGGLNKKRDKMSEEEIRTKYTEDELMELGDESPFFRYTI